MTYDGAVMSHEEITLLWQEPASLAISRDELGLNYFQMTNSFYSLRIGFSVIVLYKLYEK